MALEVFTSFGQLLYVSGYRCAAQCDRTIRRSRAGNVRLVLGRDVILRSTSLPLIQQFSACNRVLNFAAGLIALALLGVMDCDICMTLKGNCY